MKKHAKLLIMITAICLLFAVCAIAVFANEKTPAEKLLSEIVTTPPTLSQSGEEIILPTLSNDAYELKIYGSSNPSVIDENGKVYAPLVDTEVGIMYKVVSKTNSSEFAVDEYKEAKIMIKGKYETSPGENAEPAVFPKLREWKGGTGTVSFTETSRIVVAHPDFLGAATKALEYIKAITGFDTKLVESPYGTAGDVVFTYADSKELGAEGYTIELSDVISVAAYSETGALYGGTTIAQMLDLYDGFALPRGYVRDYPQYAVRSIMLDVARYYVPMESLREFSKYMAYFKINTVHVHINDSYGQQKYAFRVESKKYPEINSNLNGNYYTQDEYRAYQREMLGYGIKVVTEIDSPGHAGFVAKYDPTLIVPSNETYINLSTDVHSTVGGVSYTYYDKSVEFMKGLFEEFIGGEDPVVIDEIETFHVGMDEYTWNHQQFKIYMKEMTDYVKSLGKKPQVWSSLQTADFSGELPIDTDVAVNYWGFADFERHLEAGFPCVANNPMKLYVVPGGTNSFVDRLSLEALYTSYKVNVLQNEKLEISEASPLLLGAEAAFWNDANVGVSIFDIFSRLRDQILIISEKAWYGNNAEDASVEEFLTRVEFFKDGAPLVNPSRFVEGNQNGDVLEYDFENVEGNTVKDALGNYDAVISGLETVKVGSGNMLKLNGEGYLSLPFNTLGNPFTASFELIYEGSENGVLFESDDGKLIINYKGTGKIAYSRDMMTYTFRHVFKEGIQYNIKIVSDLNDCYLYVNGVFDSKGEIETMLTEDKAAHRIKFTSFALPCEKIGAGVVGYIDNLKLSNKAESHDKLSGLEYVNYGNVALGKDVSASGVEVTTKWGPECAVDGILSSTDTENKTSLNNAHDAWLVIDLGKEYEIDKIVIEFAQRPAKYSFLVSVDGKNYETVHTETEKKGGARGTDTVNLEGKRARYVKYQTVEMFLASNNYYYSGNFHEIMVYSTDINTEIIDKAKGLIGSLSGYEKAFLESSVELVEYVLNNNGFEDAGIALKCLDDLCEELASGEKLTSTADRSLISALIKTKLPEASYSQESYKAYEYEYRFAIGTALDLSASDEGIKEYASRIEKSTLALIGPAKIESNMNFDAPENMLDSNEASFATGASNQAKDQYIILRYENGIALKSFKISCAASGKTLASADVFVSYDGTNFVPVTSYSLTNYRECALTVGGSYATMNEVFFPKTLSNVVAIKITLKESVSRVLQINEIYVNHLTDVEAIAPGISSLKAEDYTKDSFKYMLPFASGMATTRFYLNNAQSYMKHLVKCADKEAVLSEIERLSAISADGYTATSFGKLSAKIAKAEAFLANLNGNESIYDSDEVIKGLKASEDALIKEISGIDTSALEEALSRSVNPEDYTYYSFAAYNEAAKAAFELLKSEAYSDDSLSMALAKLERAYSNLSERNSSLNVALGKDVIVSGLESGNAATKAEFATDGIESGVSNRVCLNNSDDAWIIVDLGKEYLIDKIDILWCRKSAAYRILVSVDGTEWEEVYKDLSGKKEGAEVTDTVKLPYAVNARYVKLQNELCFFGNAEKNYFYCGTFYEINVTAADTTPYTAELEYAYENAQDTSELHPKCASKLSAALIEAERVLKLENATQAEIENALLDIVYHEKLAWEITNTHHSFTCECGTEISEKHEFKDEVCSVCAHEINKYELELLTTQLLLSDGIRMDFAFLFDASFDSAEVEFDFVGKKFKGEFIGMNADGNYVYRFNDILPQYMTDVIKVCVTLKSENGDITKEFDGVSVKGYLESVLELYAEDDALVRLASDILVYGREAQLYANYKTDSLATDGVDIKPSFAFKKPESVRAVRGSNSSYSFQSAGLNLHSYVNMYFTFKAKSISGLSVKISINGRETIYDAANFVYSGGVYKIYFDGIMAHEFGDTVTAEFLINGEASGISVDYSVDSYVAESKLLKTNPASELIKALSNYGKSAFKYKEANEQ